MSWVIEHWDDLVTIATGLMALALVIVKLTPSKKDDEFLAKLIQGIKKEGKDDASNSIDDHPVD